MLYTEKSQTFVACVDVAAGMVQIADEGGERWGGKSVSVLSGSKAKLTYESFQLLFE